MASPSQLGHTRNMLSAMDLERLAGSHGSTRQSFCESALSELHGLDGARVKQYYPRGTILFVEGQGPSGIYSLREGRVKVSITSADGRKLLLRIAHQGDVLGLNGTLTGQPYGAMAETMDRCLIDFISRENLLRLLDIDQRVYAGLAQALTRKLGIMVEHTRLLFLSQSASERLARLLVKWCDEHGERTPRGIRINAGLTHEEIAQMICSSRETVTRLFAQMRRSEIVSLSDHAIFVRNRNALEMLARC